MAQPYQYQRLNHSGQQIRLLNLRLFEDAQPDHFPLLLETFDIESAPTYVALSYTWGSPTPIHKIAIGKTYLPAGPTLQSFFFALSCSKKAKYKRPTGHIWIDQLCIDQQNAAERNNQVGMMSEIYSRAVCTLIWLNNDSRIYNEPSPWSAHDISPYLLCRHLSHISLFRYFTLKKTKKNKSTALFKFLGRRY